VTLLYAQSSADLNVPTILTAYPVLIFVVLFLTWAILWHGTTRYVPKADRLLIKRLGCTIRGCNLSLPMLVVSSTGRPRLRMEMRARAPSARSQ
jgi:hypothetical protein